MSCLNFERITASDGNKVLPYTFSYGERSCVWSFAQMFRYSDSFAIQDDIMFVLKNSLCTPTKRVYSMPLCSNEKLHKAIELIVNDALFHNAVPYINNTTEQVASVLKNDFSDTFKILEDRDYFEYIYFTENLANFSGGKYQAKRNLLKNFLRDYGDNCTVLPFGQSDSDSYETIIKSILEFQVKWVSMIKELPTYQELAEEDRRIRLMLENYKALDISGFEVRINGSTAGYAFGNKCSEDCFDLIVEKADTSFKGIYQYINNQVAKTIAKDCTYINMEEDIGLEGLRKSKLSYNPCFMIKKFNAEYIS